MNIRFANSQDKNIVLRLLNELGEVENEVRGYSPAHTKAHIFGEKMYEEIIANKDAKIFLAEENEKVIGVATFFLIPYVRYGKKRGYIIDFVVSKEARGKRVGTQLVRAIKEFSKANGIQRVKVDTGLPRAKKFYAKNGGVINTETFTLSTEE